MQIRLANKNDLEFLKNMYYEIVNGMYENDIKIWNDFYPCEVLHEDIENNRLYVLENDKEIIAACALCESNDGERFVKWNEDTKNVLYIDRLGVNTNYLRQGIGQILLNKMKEIAKEKDAKYLRLFVAYINTPAINLYLKNGFRRVDGIYEEKIDEDYYLLEFGFEIKL